jgi:8-oxo-dGTP pyrophosphatase MutT (NUDIX family)
MKQKVLAYIIRHCPGGKELLVFDHRDFSDAGVQVPAGTVEEGESLEQALFREVREESGLTGLTLLRKLGESEEPEWNRHRHYYLLEATGELPDRWEWVTNDFHDEAHRERNEPLVFCFRWVRLGPGLVLAGNQHQMAERIEEGG